MIIPKTFFERFTDLCLANNRCTQSEIEINRSDPHRLLKITIYRIKVVDK